jgi:hypothetical protein
MKSISDKDSSKKHISEYPEWTLCGLNIRRRDADSAALTMAKSPCKTCERTERSDIKRERNSLLARLKEEDKFEAELIAWVGGEV